MRWWTWTLLACAVAGGTAVMVYQHGEDANATPDAGRPLTEPVLAKDGVVSEGSVVPVRFSALSVPTSGVVQHLRVKEGDLVQEGQVLLELDRRELEARLAAARAELVRALATVGQAKAVARPQELAIKEAALSQARADEQHARTNLTRTQRLRTENVLSDTEVEAARAALDRAIAARQLSEADHQLVQSGPRSEPIAVAQASVASARAMVLQMEALVDSAILRAPFTGVVAFLEVQPGEFVTPGMPVVRVADTSRWFIRTEDLTELAVVLVRPGATVKITADAIPGLELTGHVVHVRPFGERKKGDMTYTATIEPDIHDPRLRWNMTVSVRILPQPDAATTAANP